MSDPTQGAVAVGDDAPTFTLPTAGDEGIDPRPLGDHIADGPAVLAFFPGAFSGTCTAEFSTFRDRLLPLAGGSGTVLGISTDLPWALATFREQESLPFPLAADNDAAVCEAYGVDTRYERWDIDAVTRRAVFVVDEAGVVTYRWLADDPGQEPPYDEVAAAVNDAARR